MASEDIPDLVAKELQDPMSTSLDPRAEPVCCLFLARSIRFKPDVYYDFIFTVIWSVMAVTITVTIDNDLALLKSIRPLGGRSQQFLM